MLEPLRVDPVELRLAGGRIEGHAGEFLTTHQSTHERAGQLSIGSGAASAALAQMLGAWETTGAHFATQHTKHADGHHQAAAEYASTDTDSAASISGAVK